MKLGTRTVSNENRNKRMLVKGETQVEKKIKLTNEFEKALPVLNKIKEAGYEAYFVGGSVRDALLGLQVNDVDIASSAMPEEIKQIFGKTIDVGIEHGTVMVLNNDESYEITTFRTESTYKDFRRPDSVSFVRSLKEDLKRRDLTINAFAVDEEGRVIDYFDGLKDLDNKVIRAVGEPEERFHEDALRMMRAVRFAAQLDFEIEEQTMKAILHNRQLLEKIAVERINVEFVKLLLSPARKKGIKAMMKTKLYMNCPGLNRNKLALVQMTKSDKQIMNERQAWALFIYYILFMHPKPETYSVSGFLKTWKTSNKMIEDVQQLVQGLNYRVDQDLLSPWLIFQLGEELTLEVEELMVHLEEEPHFEETQEAMDQLPIKTKQELAVSGNDVLEEVDQKAGKWLGDILNEVLVKVVEGDLENDKESLLTYIRQYV